jgi:hypothetical protein
VAVFVYEQFVDWACKLGEMNAFISRQSSPVIEPPYAMKASRVPIHGRGNGIHREDTTYLISRQSSAVIKPSDGFPDCKSRGWQYNDQALQRLSFPGKGEASSTLPLLFSYSMTGGGSAVIESRGYPPDRLSPTLQLG